METESEEEMMTTWRWWCIGPRDNQSCHDSPDLSSTNSSAQSKHYHDMDDIVRKHHPPPGCCPEQNRTNDNRFFSTSTRMTCSWSWRSAQAAWWSCCSNSCLGWLVYLTMFRMQYAGSVGLVVDLCSTRSLLTWVAAQSQANCGMGVLMSWTPRSWPSFTSLWMRWSNPRPIYSTIRAAAWLSCCSSPQLGWVGHATSALT